MRIRSGFLLIFLISSIILIIGEHTPTAETQPNPPGTEQVMGSAFTPPISTVNWTHFWQLFNAHTEWDLEYDDGGGWTSINSDLQVIKNYTARTDEGMIPVPKVMASNVKITLNFTASYTADYRLTFAIDLAVKNYTHHQGAWNYTITYQNYTVLFDFSDIRYLPLDGISHGVTDIGGTDYFWFRIRKNNIQQGKNTVIDPSFGHYDIETLLVDTDDRVSGSWFTCPEAGTGTTITAYIRTYYDGTKVKMGLYKKSDDSFVAGTDEWTHTGGDGYIFQWLTCNFTGSPSLTNQDYWLCVWADKYCLFYADGGNSGKGIRDEEVYGDTYPDPLDGVSKDYLHSIYCNYTTGAGEEWNAVETWSFNLNATASWHSAETWSFNLNASNRLWIPGETWSFNLNATASWTPVETWSFNLNATASFKAGETWSFSLSTILNSAPTVGSFTASKSEWESEQNEWVSVTIDDADGVADFVNCSLVFDDDLTHTFTLLWTSATNTFSEGSDPMNYVILNSGARTTVNSTAYTLKFTFLIRDNMPEEPIDVEATVIDDSDTNGTGTSLNLFTFTHAPGRGGIDYPYIPVVPVQPFSGGAFTLPKANVWTVALLLILGVGVGITYKAKRDRDARNTFGENGPTFKNKLQKPSGFNFAGSESRKKLKKKKKRKTKWEQEKPLG